MLWCINCHISRLPGYILSYLYIGIAPLHNARWYCRSLVGGTEPLDPVLKYTRKPAMSPWMKQLGKYPGKSIWVTSGDKIVPAVFGFLCSACLTSNRNFSYNLPVHSLLEKSLPSPQPLPGAMISNWPAENIQIQGVPEKFFQNFPRYIPDSEYFDHSGQIWAF